MVSVITVTYNRRTLLDKAIRSVLNQTYSDFEYLVVDDGSTDGSEQLVKSFQDPRINYIYREHSGYISKLKNVALDHARGEIIAFLDSDDTWEPLNLEKTVAIFEQRQADSVVSNATIVTEGHKIVLFKREESFLLSGNLLRQRLFNDKFLIYTSCFSYRSSSFNLRYNENLRAGDNDFFLKILSVGNAVVLLDQLTIINRHTDNMSAPVAYDAPFIQAYYEDLETFKFLRDQKKIAAFTYRKAASRHLYKIGRNLTKINRTQEARKYFLKAFLTFPPNAKALFKYFYLQIR